MRRRVRIILLVLLGGAIVNVAVAWGCALFQLPSNGYEYTVEEVVSYVARHGLHVSPDDTAFGDRSKGWGLELQHYVLDAAHRDGDSIESILTLSGWPMRSLGAEMYGIGKTAEDLYGNFRLSGGLRIPESIREPHTFHWTFPLRPLWPGFAINTIFYAGILWMLFAFPFVVRRRRRIKRGLCPACAYPVGTSPVCTECGKPVKQSAISGQQSAEVQS